MRFLRWLKWLFTPRPPPPAVDGKAPKPKVSGWKIVSDVIDALFYWS